MSTASGLQRTVRAYRESLAFLPEGDYRRYCAWLLDQPGYSRRWLRLIGLDELVRMTTVLLGGLPLERAEVDLLTSYSTLMSVHQVYEVVSDNLAIGLCGAATSTGPQSTGPQEEVLRSFNPAAVASLRAMDPGPARERFPQWRALARQVSAFGCSNNETEHRVLMAAYLGARPEEEPQALEFSLAPNLLANVEAGLAMAAVARDLATWDLFINGLIRRYSAVQRLITERPTDAARLIAIGTDSIMVVPTLAYYTGLINEVVRPLPGYAKALDDGSVQRLLSDAALLVRLVNDVGTMLLRLRADARRRGQLAIIWSDFQAPFSEFAVRLVGGPLARSWPWHLTPRAAQLSRVRVPALKADGEIGYFQDFSQALESGIGLARSCLSPPTTS